MSKNEPEITLKDIHNDLSELLKWIKFSGIQEIKPKLESILNTDNKKTVYQLSDGKSKPEIAKLSNVNADTIKGYWRNWKKLGITKSQSFSGGPRQIRLFDLTDFNLIPESAKENTKKKSEE